MRRVRYSKLAYKELMEKFEKELFTIDKFANLFNAGALKDKELLGQIQTMIFDFGTRLEKEYGFENTEIIRALERSCEGLYSYSNGEMDQSSLAKDMMSISKVLADSIEITDKRLSVVATMKNESRYVVEWIEYHRMNGVDHFYIYDNESDDGMDELLRVYEEDGIVTIIPFPGELAELTSTDTLDRFKEMQLKAYDHALENYKNDTDYMAFIDADEFMVVADEEAILPDVIEEIFRDYDNKRFRLDFRAGGIGINWRMYGTSGVKSDTDGLITQTLLNRAADHYDENAHIKIICNPRAVDGFKWTVHMPSFISGYIGITENGSYLTNSHVFYDGRYEKIWINHYYTRSESHYIRKLKRDWAKKMQEIGEEKYIEEELQKKEVLNEIYDPIMLRYGDRLANAVKGFQGRVNE